MNFCIQDPSYKESMYLHETILDASKGGINGGGAYAFASRGGIELLLADETFKQFLEKGKFFLVVGMDDITNIRALQTLKAFVEKYSGHLTVKAYIHNNKGSTFHPKYCWFQKIEGGVLIIGSGNLTEQGLRHNREAYSVIDCNAEEISSVAEKWDEWIAHSQPFLFDIDDTRVLSVASKNATKAHEVAKAKKAVLEKADTPDEQALKELFQKQPKDLFKKKRLPLQKKESEKKPVITPPVSITIPVVADYNEDDYYWTISPDSDVLVAEIPKSGDRWKQVNFSKEVFEDFFGATCGENGVYRVLLKNVNSHGTVGDTEVRPSVSVSSHNYRFELDAATGLEYPKGKNRPIGVFAKVSERDFLYQLVMPDDIGYNSLTSALDKREHASSKMRRLTYLCKDISEETSELAIWRHIDEDNYDN